MYSSQPGDPVKLVSIVKGGEEIQPGTYGIPRISGDRSRDTDAVDDWLKDVSFVLLNQTKKTITSVGLSVVLPVRRTDSDCVSSTGSKSSPSPWCDAHPDFCDGGCPALIQKTLHWGQIPAEAVSALKALYRDKNVEWATFQGKESLQITPGQQIQLSLAGRGDGLFAVTDRGSLSPTS